MKNKQRTVKRITRWKREDLQTEGIVLNNIKKNMRIHNEDFLEQALNRFVWKGAEAHYELLKKKNENT